MPPDNLIIPETSIKKILQRKPYCVIKFLEKPFVDIDKQVCVPSSWLSVRKSSVWWKVNVSYPKDEDPSETIKRVKRRETFDKTWSTYMAEVVYSAGCYIDADYFRRRSLESISYFGEEYLDAEDYNLRSTRKPPSDPKTSKPQVTVKLYEKPQKPMIKKLIKRPVQSKPKGHRNRKNTRLDEAAKSTSAIVNNATTAPGCSKREQSITFQDDQLIQSDQTEKTAVFNGGNSTVQRICPQPSVAKPDPTNTHQSIASKLSGEKQPSPVRQDSVGKEPSMPSLNVDEPTVVINSNKEIQPESIAEQKPSSSQISSHASQQPCQPDSVEETQTPVTCLDNPLQKPPRQEISVNKSKKTNGYRQKTHLHCNTMAARIIARKSLTTANQSSQPFQHTQLPTVSRNSFLNSQPQEINVRRPTEVTHVNQIPHIMRNIVPSTFQLLPKYASGKPSLSVIKKPVNKKNHLENIVRTIATAAVQNSTNSRDQFVSLPTCSLERQAPLVTQNHPLIVPQIPEMFAGNCIEGNGNGQRSILRGIANSSQKVPREPEIHVRESNEVNRINHRTFHQNITHNTSSAQNLTNSAHHHRSRCFVQQLDDRNSFPTQEDHIQHIARAHDMLRTPNRAQSINQRAFSARDRLNPANQYSESLSRSHEYQYQPYYQYHEQQDRLRQELLMRSTETYHSDHGHHPQNIGVRVSAVQNPSNVSNQFHRGSVPERQLPPSHQHLQREPRLTGTGVGISMKTNSKSQRPGPRGVTKRTPPHVLPKASNSKGQVLLTGHKNYLLEDPRTQASLSRRSTEQNNRDVAAVPRNITAEPTPVMHNVEVPLTCSCHQSHEIQLTPVYENNVHRNPCTQKNLVDQSTETNFTMKRVYFEDDIVRLPGTESSPRVVGSACQTDEKLIEEPQSPYQEVVSDNEAVLNHEVVSDHEISTEEAPLEIVNDDDCTGDSIFSLSPENDSADTPVQNSSTSANHQVHPRTIVEQQMLDEFATLITQMRSTLSNMCGMFNVLKRSIEKSAEI